MDMRFAEKKTLKQYDCKTCKKPMKAQNKCEMDGYNNSKRPIQLDKYSLQLSFCPAKATWSHRAAVLFGQCRLAYETGIMPEAGSLEDQEALFSEVFPFFVERWSYRKDQFFWKNVSDLSQGMVESIGKMLGAKFGGH